jgi:hypothetical protein
MVWLISNKAKAAPESAADVGGVRLVVSMALLDPNPVVMVPNTVRVTMPSAPVVANYEYTAKVMMAMMCFGG